MKRISTLLILSLVMCIASYSQSRAFIRDQIDLTGKCRNVAITETNGNLMLYGNNGWAGNFLPSGLEDALTELNSASEFINDVQITEEGSWLVLYGKNGLRWDGIPPSLESKLRYYNEENEVITSVTFNDIGDWIVITKNYISASDKDIENWLADGISEYGKLWAACLTDDACVVVYQEGFRFLGKIPEDLKEALSETEINVYRIKIAGSCWFFADKNGFYMYNM
ncbi:MAG: hypothetical protein ACRC5H_00215 [Treponemataceae bacterium]